MKFAPVTMIVTVHDRGFLLAQTMGHLLSPVADLTVPSQIIVVDDGSDEVHRAAIESVVEEMQRNHTGVLLLRNENPGETTPCLARNIALREAAYDEILTIEPEIYFITDVVAQLVSMRESWPEAVLHGFTYHQHTTHEPIEFCQLQEFPYYLLMKADWLEEIGGWDEHMPGPWGWDDIDMLTRLDFNFHSQVRSPQVKAKHLWHPSRIEPAKENEEYFRAKQFPGDLIANRGEEWGRLRTRTA